MTPNCYDVAVVGAGMAGLATATRLTAAGLNTIVLEQHRSAGGCAGYFRRRGFAFDAGATTLVDFEADGEGGRWLREIGIDDFAGEKLPGYVAWLPDRTVTLYRDPARWAVERLRLSDTPKHRAFWVLLDKLASGISRPGRSGRRPGGDELLAFRPARPCLSAEIVVVGMAPATGQSRTAHVAAGRSTVCDRIRGVGNYRHPVDVGTARVWSLGLDRQLGLPAANGSSSAPPLRRLTPPANPYAPRQSHSRPVPRAYVSPGTSPVPAGAEPSLGRAVQAFDAIL